MTNILSFDLVEAPTATQVRLRYLSRGLALLFTLGMALSALWIAGAFLMSFVFSDHVRIGAEGALIDFPHPSHATSGMTVYASQPLLTHLAGFVDVLVAMTPVIFVCWHLRLLFRLYAGGVVFARENAMHLKRIGLWLLAYPFAKFGANILFRLAGGTDTTWFRGELLDALLLGAIVYAIALVMEFGHEIEQDRAEII